MTMVKIAMSGKNRRKKDDNNLRCNCENYQTREPIDRIYE